MYGLSGPWGPTAVLPLIYELRPSPQEQQEQHEQEQQQQVARLGVLDRTFGRGPTMNE